MKSIRNRSNYRGFTLVEIMIVVAIIALLASIAVPNFLRARKRSEASKILEDLRQIDNATDEYAIENNKTGGTNPVFADIKNYLKTGTPLYNTGTDLFGDSYGPFTVDTVVGVPSAAFNALSDVAPVSFWSPYFWSAGS
jgi:prepilin-type N-terminal cleavage/methylation domain-containing protein